MREIFSDDCGYINHYPMVTFKTKNGKKYKKVGESYGNEIKGGKRFLKTMALIGLVVSGILSLGIPFAFKAYHEKIGFLANEIKFKREILVHYLPINVEVPRIDQLSRQYHDLMNEAESLMSSLNVMKEIKGNLEKDVQEAKETIALKELAKKEHQLLEIQKNQLEKEILNLKLEKEKFNPEEISTLKKEISELNKRSCEIKSDIEQNSFKERYKKMHALYEDELRHSSAEYQRGLQKGYENGFAAGFPL